MSLYVRVHEDDKPFKEGKGTPEYVAYYLDFSAGLKGGGTVREMLGEGDDGTVKYVTISGRKMEKGTDEVVFVDRAEYLRLAEAEETYYKALSESGFKRTRTDVVKFSPGFVRKKEEEGEENTVIANVNV